MSQDLKETKDSTEPAFDWSCVTDDTKVEKSDRYRKSVRGAGECAEKMKQAFKEYLKYNKNAFSIFKSFASFEDKQDAVDEAAKLRASYESIHTEFANILSVPGYDNMGYKDLPDDDEDGIKLDDLRDFLTHTKRVWPRLKSQDDTIVEKALDDVSKAFDRFWTNKT